ncbi:MAG: hypothetical protein U0821_23590 [Chloroflexota bacterium]
MAESAPQPNSSPTAPLDEAALAKAVEAMAATIDRLDSLSLEGVEPSVVFIAGAQP